MKWVARIALVVICFIPAIIIFMFLAPFEILCWLMNKAEW